MSAQATGRGGERGGKQGGSYQSPKQKFSPPTTNDPEEGASSGEGRGYLGRPEPKKASNKLKVKNVKNYLWIGFQIETM